MISKISNKKQNMFVNKKDRAVIKMFVLLEAINLVFLNQRF